MLHLELEEERQNTPNNPLAFAPTWSIRNKKRIAHEYLSHLSLPSCFSVFPTFLPCSPGTDFIHFSRAKEGQTGLLDTKEVRPFAGLGLGGSAEHDGSLGCSVRSFEAGSKRDKYSKKET